MNFKFLVGSIFGLMILASCQQSPKPSENSPEKLEATSSNLEAELPGNYLAERVFVVYGDRPDTIDAHAKDFKRVLKIQNNKAVYREDGTYTSTYIDTLGNDGYSFTGGWWAEGDTLFNTFYAQDDTIIHKYHTIYKGDLAIFEGMVDWDNDGQQDDFVHIESRRSR